VLCKNLWDTVSGAPGNVSTPPQVRGATGEDLRPPHMAADPIIRAAAFPILHKALNKNNFMELPEFVTRVDNFTKMDLNSQQ